MGKHKPQSAHMRRNDKDYQDARFTCNAPWYHISAHMHCAWEFLISLWYKKKVTNDLEWFKLPILPYTPGALLMSKRVSEVCSIPFGEKNTRCAIFAWLAIFAWQTRCAVFNSSINILVDQQHNQTGHLLGEQVNFRPFTGEPNTDLAWLAIQESG